MQLRVPAVMFQCQITSATRSEVVSRLCAVMELRSVLQGVAARNGGNEQELAEVEYNPGMELWCSFMQMEKGGLKKTERKRERENKKNPDGEPLSLEDEILASDH